MNHIILELTEEIPQDQLDNLLLKPNKIFSANNAVYYSYKYELDSLLQGYKTINTNDHKELIKFFNSTISPLLDTRLFTQISNDLNKIFK
jgi:hypothetical protein